jgi:hypothetical protein
MREEELIEEGFQKIIVSIEESGDKTDYYFYNLNLNEDVVLTSSTNEDSAIKNWVVYFNNNNIIIKNIEDVQTLIALVKKCTKKTNNV